MQIFARKVQKCFYVIHESSGARAEIRLHGMVFRIAQESALEVFEVILRPSRK